MFKKQVYLDQTGKSYRRIKRKIKLWLILIPLIFLIIFISLLILGIKVNFILNDELNIGLSPLDASMTVHNDESAEIDFYIKNNNFAECNSLCDFLLKDLQNNKVLYQENRTMEHDEVIKKRLTINPRKKGEGQALYQFEVKCNNVKSLLCFTDEKPRYKSALISISYVLTGEEAALKPILKEKIESWLSDIKEGELLSEQNKIAIKQLPANVLEKKELGDISNDLILTTLKEKRDRILYLWNDEDYTIVSEEFLESDINESNFLKNQLKAIQEEIFSLRYLRNQDISMLEEAKYSMLLPLLEHYSSNNLSTTELEDIATNLYASYLVIKNDDATLEREFDRNIALYVERLRERLSEYELNFSENIINLTIPQSILDLRSMNFSFENFNKENIELPIVDINSITSLDDNGPKCCTFNLCRKCCDESCSSNEKLYPVVFIHGHAFNEANSPEYSMNSFTEIQRKLQNDGYINAGELNLRASDKSSKGELGKSGRTVSFRSSYYYILHYDIKGLSITAQKSERIENYAIRLKEIIDAVKYKTGSNKVNIVAHSMGGLVAREYLSLFGDDNVNKVILINTPNNGVSGNVEKLCSVIGSSKECNDMSAGSIFLSRLNSKKMPENSKIYAIRSTGCLMEENKIGDGIVTNKSAYLEGAKNYLIRGRCTDSLQTDLHTNVLDPNAYPQTYLLIKDILAR